MNISYIIFSEINNDAKKVSKCLETDGQEIINLLVSYYNVTSICFNPALKPLLISLQPLLVDLKKEDESVAALAPLLDQCKNEICVFGVSSFLIFHKIFLIIHNFFRHRS